MMSIYLPFLIICVLKQNTGAVNTTLSPTTHEASITKGLRCPWSCEITSSASSCGRTWQPVKKIAGGKKIERYSWPWMAALWSNGSLICGGTLVCRSWVLTAAHCFLNKNGAAVDLERKTTLYLGRYLRKGFHRTVRIFRVTKEMVTIHENYHIKNRENDIALVRLPKPMRVTSKIRPVCLPQFGAGAPKVGTKCRVAGWGDTMGFGPTNYRLKEATIPIVSTDTCKYLYYFSKTQIILCAGGTLGEDTCMGDSGGPLICESSSSPSQWQIQGIISFGARNCGKEKLPGIYTQVPYYLFWIYTVVENECEKWTKTREYTVW